MLGTKNTTIKPSTHNTRTHKHTKAEVYCDKIGKIEREKKEERSAATISATLYNRKLITDKQH